MNDSDVKILEKKISGDLRKAQSSMFSGKNEEAWNMIEAVWADIERLKNIDPNNRLIISLVQQYTRLKHDLEKKLKKGVSVVTQSVIVTTIPKFISTQISPQASVPTKTIDEGKLPGGVVKRLEEIENRLQQAENSLRQVENSSTSERTLRQIEFSKSTYEELERMYKDQIGHPDVQKIKEKISALNDKFSAISEKLESDEAESREIKSNIENRSKKWVEKMVPYTSSGVSKNKLELSRIRGKENLLRQKKLLVEVKNLIKEYETSDWPFGKTSELEKAEKELRNLVNEGHLTYDQSVQSILDEAKSVVDEKFIELKNDNAWRTDSSLRPNWILKREREVIDEKMSLVKELVPDIIPKDLLNLINLENNLCELENENLERLAVLPMRTFMAPSKYKGDDSEVLKAKTEQLVKENVPKAEILKVHLIREDWRIEDVIEHTDTSRTAIRHRITYHLPAQLAARVGGMIFLYNVHISKNQRLDGSFDSLFGNLEEYIQQIAVENIPN